MKTDLSLQILHVLFLQFFYSLDENFPSAEHIFAFFRLPVASLTNSSFLPDWIDVFFLTYTTVLSADKQCCKNKQLQFHFIGLNDNCIAIS